jgi:hypothetical protein
MYRILPFLFLVPNLASAIDMPGDLKIFIGKVLDNIVNPLVLVMFALASLYLLKSVVEFVFNQDNMKDVKKLKSAMIWGVIGVTVMASVFGLVQFVANSLRSAGVQTIDIN